MISQFQFCCQNAMVLRPENIWRRRKDLTGVKFRVGYIKDMPLVDVKDGVKIFFPSLGLFSLRRQWLNIFQASSKRE